MPPKPQIFSSTEELNSIATILGNYVRLPFTSENIPGAVMEGVLAHVRISEVLRTYDFIDVLDREKKIGWQVKCTRESTPLTWKRAKIADSARLIEQSEKNDTVVQELGNAIITFCNEHAMESIRRFNLSQIGYSRVVLHKDRDVTYFERLLCSKAKPLLFNAKEFTWKWSKQKKGRKKQQLPALHGTHVSSGKKWFAWHGRGENQLHFTGEKDAWWPKPGTHANVIRFKLPQEQLSIEQFTDLLAAASNPLPEA